MTDYARTFEEEVLERLARIEIKVDEIPSVKDRVSKLEAHRNWMAGAFAACTGLVGYLHLKV
jgi:hypothetical protein